MVLLVEGQGEVWCMIPRAASAHIFLATYQRLPLSCIRQRVWLGSLYITYRALLLYRQRDIHTRANRTRVQE
jgi:hypothetical protein